MDKLYKFFNSKYNHLDEGYIKYNKKGKILFINNACLSLFKYPIYPKNIVPLTIFDLMDKKHHDPHLKRLNKKLKNGENMLNKNVIGLCYDGTKIKIDITILPCNKLIIKQPYVNKELLEDRIKLLDDLESMIDVGYWEWCINKNDLVWSEGLKKIYEINNTTYTDYMKLNHPADINYIQTTIDLCLKNKKDYVLRHRIITYVSKKIKWIEARGRYVQKQDGNLYILGIVRDITNEQTYKQQKEDAEESSRIKSSFVASVSHEIRTPLNGIIGMVSLLETTELKKKQQDYIKVLRSSCGILLSIINNILDFSKIESGNIAPDLVPSDIGTCIKDVCQLFTPSCDMKKVELIVDVKLSKYNMITDSIKISQILSNLLSNSIKFTPTGKNIKVSVRNDKTTLYINVKDTGIGIPKEFLNKISTPFTQADNTTTRLYGGTGLGLSIVKSYIDILKGTFSIESVEGESTNINITIPIVLDDLQNSIIIVEDNLANQYIIKEILSNLTDKDIICYNNGKIAVESINYNPLIIFMDLHMPQLDGHDASIAIRKNGITCPIIALTANSMKDERKKCIISGMNDFILKPVTIDIIKSVLKQYNLI